VHNLQEEIEPEELQIGRNETQVSANLDGPIIEFKNVYLKYPTSKANVLNDISFQIYSQQKVGIIGRYIKLFISEQEQVSQPYSQAYLGFIQLRMERSYMMGTISTTMISADLEAILSLYPRTI
jgi:hypothetical protein